VPELPDLHYIAGVLTPRIRGRRIDDVTVREPVVLRMLLAGADGGPLSFTEALKGRTFSGLRRHGPFLSFSLDGCELVIHCMLSGRLQLAAAGDKPLAHLCFTLLLDDASRLSYGDDTRMGKVYVAGPGRFESIPGYASQGVDVTSDGFTVEAFDALIRGRRQQARVFLMDQSALSAIGNAYADEILFAAGIHPKTPCSGLTPEEKRGLYDSIRSVMAWGIAEVRKAGQPIEVKVRGHLKVRNRKDEPCPVCGTTIRRAGVLGYDSFFCPSCQPPKKTQSIPW
jgi:formamidopyrimidine-DNA glycosylase